MIYFDNAATTYPKPNCVYKAIEYGMKNYAFNAGRGTYKEAANTYKMIQETRDMIANIVHSSRDKVVFTSSATESINGIVYGLNLTEDDYVLISCFEHNAVVRCLANHNIKYDFIPFDKQTWELKYEDLNNLIVLRKPKAIIISHVSNVTGFELPYNKIFELGKKYNTINVLDAAQSFGILDINTQNVDFVVFAGHKSLYGIFGIAGFININNTNLKLYKAGGTGSDSLNIDMPLDMPFRYEPGSLNSISIYALNVAINYLTAINSAQVINELSQYLINKLMKLDNIICYLPRDKESHGIISLNIKGYKSDEVGEILSNDYDICVRTGYHCCPYIHDFINSKEYSGTVRISLGIFNTYEEIDKLISVIKEL